MFTVLGQWIAAKPWAFVAIWAMLVGAGMVWAMLAEPMPPGDVGSFLPADSPHNRAVRTIKEAFPNLAARSRIIFITERQEGLTNQDFDWLGKMTRLAGAATENRTLSPTTVYLRPRLVSRDRQSAMAVVSLSSNFISTKTIDSVKKVEALLAQTPPPDGLKVEITGTAGIGRDYFAATEQALHNTTWVTVIAVLVILVVIYRSPIGALVPLVSIGASVYLAFVVLAILARAGWEISNMERIFAVVLLFGAGVDYALFWIARYREPLQNHADINTAAITATCKAGPAIIASAATTICGLTTMLATDLVPTRCAGKVLAAVLVVSLMASLTLSPAFARLLGRALFWPVKPQGGMSIGQRFVWPPIAERVTRHPGKLLLTGTVLLIILSLLSTKINFRFDSLSELPPGSSSSRGFDIANEHFSKGQLYSNTLLLKFDRKPESSDDLKTMAKALTKGITNIDGVYDVYSLSDPLGKSQKILSWLSTKLLPKEAKDFYLDASDSVLRFEILIDYMPFSFEAMNIIDRVRELANETTHKKLPSGQEAEVLLAGPTPYVIGVRAIAGKDQLRVMILATLVIALIVWALVRDLPLTIFMVAATWLTYGATLTVSQFFFVNVLGEPGLDWKVRLIVFVIVVAVGQDYNIFLVTRLLQEPQDVPAKETTRRAIVSTGAVISSCGLIMAATLGSLWAGGLLLLKQIGFALALGILIDTFFVRPLLIPSFYLATGRHQKGRKSRFARIKSTENRVPDTLLSAKNDIE